jgi:cytochrome P450
MDQGLNAAIENRGQPSPAELATAFDLKNLTAEFLEDPYPTYRALRECDPVHRMPDGSYFLTRYDDCLTVYRDTETWSSDKKTACSTSITRPASSSTIRPTTPGSASCSRRHSRHGRCAPCRTGSNTWSIVFWNTRRKRARST